MIIALVQAHTRGVNWEAVAAIAGPVTFVLGGIVGAFGRAITNKVNAIGGHLNRQDKILGQHGERLARIEGSAQRVERRQQTNGT